MSQNICNICGANYEYRNGRWKCPACGAFKAEELSNEEVTLFYNAAQKLRLCDFDEAEKAYTDIIEKFPKNPNGYWERMLSRYGIKYEEDFDGRKIPTCYAASIESVLSDRDYNKALSLADSDTKAYFEQQAQYIERVRKEWIERARKEKPYDIFICYKDSDRANGVDRTKDSIAAQDLYIHLTEQGYRVFFSRESLRDKVGEKYEPYIFNALSTAKVMLVYGSSAEYISSTWLKNEWTRYEKRLKAGEKQPNSLIVACDGFDPLELPKALASKQCFDATRRSFYTDLDAVLKRLIKSDDKAKVAEEKKKEPIKQTPIITEKPKAQTKKAPSKEKSKGVKIAIIAIVIVAVISIIAALGQMGDGSTNSVTSLTDANYGVTITADGEIFNENTKLVVGKTTDGVEHRTWVNAVNHSKGVDLQNTIVYNITCDADIKENVTVKVPYSKASSNTDVKVYYVSDNKNTIEEHSCTYANAFVEFETNHFSHYVIGEVVKNSSGGGDNTKEPAAPTLEKGILKVGVCADYPPYEYSENGEFKGIEIDIVKAIADELGLVVQFENDAFEDLLTNLTNKSVDCIIGVTETEERNELASPSYTMFAEDDYQYIIYFDKSATELKTKVNETINKLRTDGTINAIYKQHTSKTGSVKVIFDPNGGEGTRIIEFAEKNTSITMKDTVFTRPGYTFLGWGKYPGGEAIYKVGTYYEVGSESEYVIYAIWRRNENTLVFDSNGGSGEMASDQVGTGYGASLPANGFTRAGYTFLGWSENPDSVEPEYAPYDTYWMGTEAIYTLYAIWEVNENTIVFNANGGSGTMENQKINTGATSRLSECTFTRQGYLFSGWSTNPSGIAMYVDKQEYIMGTESEYTLYAIWVIADYRITYELNNGTNNIDNPVGYDVTDTPITLKAPSRNGYTFVGWFSDSRLQKECSIIAAGEVGDKTFYASWTPNQNTIVFDANGGNGTMLPQTIMTDARANLNNCSFEREGYLFAGWAITPTGEVCYVDGAEYTMGADEENALYAIWTPNQNVIVFNANGGNGTMQSVIATTDSTISLPKNGFERIGYTFIGWTTSPEGAVLYADQANYTVGTQSSVTLYAVWEYVTYEVEGLYTRDGNYIYFGEYPQTIKADTITITNTVDERGYYLGSDGSYYAAIVADPYESAYTFSTGTSISEGETYYFKVEPIRWRILSIDGENALILCDSIVANIAYQPDYTYVYENSIGYYYTSANDAPEGTYANNYKFSRVRQWLNENFYKTAFTELQQEIILKTIVDNGAQSTGDANNYFACENTEDKVFLLSYADVENSEYGFVSNDDKQMMTSDYSRATGAYTYFTRNLNSQRYNGMGNWWLRSPDEHLSGTVLYVDRNGSDYYDYSIEYSRCGIVPAMWISL